MSKPSRRLAPVLFLIPLLIGGCAARERVPDGEPTAERSQAVQVRRDASWRVRVVNRTAAPVEIRYKRYLPQEAVEAQQRAIPQDPYGNPQLAGTLAISFSDNELAPGASTLLEVIPGTEIALRRAGDAHELKHELTGPQQLSIGAEGISSSALPPAYR